MCVIALPDVLTVALALRHHYSQQLARRRAGLSAALAAAASPSSRTLLVAQLAALPASLPFFVYGESMGGAAAILAAHSGRFCFDGVLLRAPMVGIDPVSGTAVFFWGGWSSVPL